MSEYKILTPQEAKSVIEEGQPSHKVITVTDTAQYRYNHGARLTTPFTSWFLLAENQDKKELQVTELALAETLAYRDNELRELRKSPNRRDFRETNVVVV